MHDEHHHPTTQPDAAAAGGLPSLWDRTVQALGAAYIPAMQ